MPNTTESEHYDVVVVGGGPTGATVATLLAQRNRNVLVLEREVFPRYHVGESLISGIVPVMRELGVEKQLDEMFPWKYGVSLVWGNELEPWRTDFAGATPYDHSWHVDRAKFDHLLLTNAEAHGVTVVQNAKVIGVHHDDADHAVTGVSYRKDGITHHATAAFVVDASGQARVVSRQQTQLTHAMALQNVATWRYFTDFTPLQHEGDILIEAVPEVGGWLWGIPLPDGHLSVGHVAPTEQITQALADGRSKSELFDAAVAESKQASEMLAGAKQVEQERSARDFSHIADSFAGPGWIGIGDAVAFIDPLFSSGVWLGTSGAWLAARTLDAALNDPEQTATALTNYETTYRAIVADLLAYVEYFANPNRAKEDYLQKAQAASDTFSSCSQVGFVSLISGITQLPAVLGFDPVSAAPVATPIVAAPAA